MILILELTSTDIATEIFYPACLLWFTVIFVQFFCECWSVCVSKSHHLDHTYRCICCISMYWKYSNNLYLSTVCACTWHVSMRISVLLNAMQEKLYIIVAYL